MEHNLFPGSSKHFILHRDRIFHQKVKLTHDKWTDILFLGYHQQSYHQYDPQAQPQNPQGHVGPPQPQMMPQEIPQMPQVPTHEVPQPAQAQPQPQPEPVEEAQLISFD